ncbi:MAG: LuxR family transcriptional regulator, maltose regulon positive regulatory protein [Trebonia sp.]|nr:LuxR family transcriptional regulator, maltose regulon positive regulatory protein [Trebonia sp.]
MTAAAAVRAPTSFTRRVNSSEEVLLSKITAPSRPDWIVRRMRIERHITIGTSRSLTVVTGPPGAGKTTAVASWAAGARGPAAWVTLDRYDGSPSVFWSTIVKALRRAGVTFRRPPTASGRGADAGHAFLLRLASDLATQYPPVALILDDFHLVAGAGVTDGLQYLMRNARPGLRVVVCSRADPMLSLHRYRLAGELTEIRAGELGFTAPEAGLLMAHHGITLPDEPLRQLTELYEGWAAGLRMAALSIQEQPDPERFTKEFAAKDSAVAGYLIEEVLNNQPARTRDLLLKTSILDRVSAGIADELADEEQAASVLAALAAANAFVEPLGNGWYRYHKLFAEVLRLKLMVKYPGQVADLHRRAARWYQANRQLPDAVRHAIAADDWPLAAELVVDELAVGTLIGAADGDPLGECLRRMPRITAGAGPQLALTAAAIALLDIQHEAGRAALAIADDLLARIPADQELASRLAAETIRLELARRAGDLGTATTSVAALEELAGLIPADTLARQPAVGGQLQAAQGVLRFWSGQPWSGHRATEGAGPDEGSAASGATSGPASGPASGTARPDHADCCGYLALLDALQGRLQSAERVSQAAGLSGGRSTEAGQRRCGAAEVALALTHLERNELRGARDRLKRADAALRARPDKLAGATAYLVAARCRLAEGHAGSAAELIDGARQGWSPPGWLDQRLTVLESRVFASVGNIAAAVEAAERAHPGASLDAAVALAQAWLDAGELQAAAGALERGPALTDAEPDGCRLDRWLVDARLAYASGDRTRGRRSLEKALRLGQRERLRLPFAMAAAWMQPVLQSDPELAAAHRHMLQPDQVGPEIRASLPAAGRTNPLIVEQLSGREREVLGLLAGMLSTAEVANELYISVNTVKTHVKSIYRKLAATQRGEAVRRARQLQLI